MTDTAVSKVCDTILVSILSVKAVFQPQSERSQGHDASTPSCICLSVGNEPRSPVHDIRTSIHTRSLQHRTVLDTTSLHVCICTAQDAHSSLSPYKSWHACKSTLPKRAPPSLVQSTLVTALS